MAARTALGDAAFADAWAGGAALTPEQAIAEALGWAGSSAAPDPSGASDPLPEPGGQPM